MWRTPSWVQSYNGWRLLTFRWILPLLEDFKFSDNLFCFSFFHAKLKFVVYVTVSLQETAFCLKSWLWPYKVAYFYCVYPVLCMCFELKFDRSSVTKVQWAMTPNKGNWTAKHQFPMHTKCFHASLSNFPALEWRHPHWMWCFFCWSHQLDD